MNWKLMCAAVMMVAGVVQGADLKPAEVRAKAEAMRKAGNWKDALEQYQQLLAEVDDAGSREDLGHAIESLSRLNRESELDGLVEAAVVRHGDNWRVVSRAALYFQQTNHYGMILDGEFKRGNHRGSGTWTSSEERDRVRALQLYRQALQADGGAMTDAEREGVMEQLGHALTMGRTGRNRVWALGVLTPIAELPDYDDGRGLSSGSGAPVDDDGKPLFMAVPDTWDAAANDGERWRWLLAERRRLNPARAGEIDLLWAQFLVETYGVRTMAGFGWWRQQDPEESQGILQVHTLKEEESIASLAGGVQRFALPADYQFIPQLRRIMNAENGAARDHAGDLLVQVFLDRRQYGQAVTELDTVITRFGKGPDNSRQKLMDQITGDWGRFESSGMFVAGDKPDVSYVFRNAQKASLTLHKVKMSLLVQDLFEFIESNPREMDWKKTNIAAIGQRLVQDNETRYLGEKVAEWAEELKPRENHWDTRTAIEVPAETAGAYLLKAKAGDGNTSWTMVWISDTALVEHQLKDGQVFYLGEAMNGTAVQGEVEFFGYKVEYREGAKRVLKKFDVLTKRFTKKTAADGTVMLAKDELDRQYQWMAVGRGDGGRMALMGFFRHSWRDFRWDTYQSDKSLGLTDRPVYRPGQTVKIKWWSRAARYDLGDESVYAGTGLCGGDPPPGVGQGARGQEPADRRIRRGRAGVRPAGGRPARAATS